MPIHGETASSNRPSTVTVAASLATTRKTLRTPCRHKIVQQSYNDRHNRPYQEHPPREMDLRRKLRHDQAQQRNRYSGQTGHYTADQTKDHQGTSYYQQRYIHIKFHFCACKSTAFFLHTQDFLLKNLHMCIFLRIFAPDLFWHIIGL